MKQEIGWVVQKNLTSDRKTYEILEEVFKKHNISFEFIDVVPFSNSLPDFNRDRINIFYGATTFINMLYSSTTGYRNQGIFFNESFNMKTYLNYWGDMMLSSNAKILPFKEIKTLSFNDEDLLFVRPDDDSKLFNGQVLSFLEIKNQKFQIIKDDALTDDTQILISEPYKINKEWRNIIFNGKVISSSRYYKNGYLNKSATDIPKEVIELCEKACSVFTPHDIFAMDIAETGGEYYILECGCVNSVGFYDMDIENIVLSIQNYMENKFNPKLIIQDEPDYFNYDSGKKINLNKEEHQCKYCGQIFDNLENFRIHELYDCPSLNE